MVGSCSPTAMKCCCTEDLVTCHVFHFHLHGLCYVRFFFVCMKRAIYEREQRCEWVLGRRGMICERFGSEMMFVRLHTVRAIDVGHACE